MEFLEIELFKAQNSLPLRSAHLQVNGHTLHVLDQGSGPAVLFCHGFPDTADTWRKQMQAVAQAGFRAIALDMRGFGESYSPDDVNLYTSVHVAGDLVGVLDALHISQAVLIGHDWGADYAQRAAIMRPDRFCGLVSISIPFAPRGNESLWEQLRNRGLEDRYYSKALTGSERPRWNFPGEAIRSALYWLSSSPPPESRWDPINPALSMLRPSPDDLPAWLDPDYLRRTIASFERTGFETGLNYYRAVQKTFDLTAAYKDSVIEQPSLYVWGADDGLCNFFHPDTPSLDQLRDTQPNLIAQVRLENVGHWVQHEATDRLNSAILEFLKSFEMNRNQ